MYVDFVTSKDVNYSLILCLLFSSFYMILEKMQVFFYFLPWQTKRLLYLLSITLMTFRFVIS